MTKVWRHGLKIKYPCRQCGTTANGTVLRSGPAWDVRVDCCGRIHRAGWTQPVEELRRKKLVDNYVDPSKPRIESRNEEILKGRQEIIEWHKQRAENPNKKLF